MAQPRKPVGEAQANYETKREAETAPTPVQTASREAARARRDDDRAGRGRQRRKPLGTAEPRLHASVPPGMVGRFFNDVPGRIARAQEAGYDFVSDDGELIRDREGGRKEIVGMGRDNAALHAYLMAIPEEFYTEDQDAKQDVVNETDDAIRRGVPQQAEAKDQQRFYSPHGENVISSGLSK